MLARVSNKLSSFFVKNNVIKSEDKEVYIYSLEILFSTILNFIAVIFISLITKSFFETVFYLIGFIPLRSLAGGYHAKNHFRCFLIMLFAYSIFLISIKFLPMNMMNMTMLVLAVITTILIFLLSPVEDKNKPLSKIEMKTFKKKSRISILIYITVIFVLYFLLPNKYYVLSLTFGITTVALSLLASVIRNKINACKSIKIKKERGFFQ